MSRKQRKEQDYGMHSLVDVGARGAERHLVCALFAHLLRVSGEADGVVLRDLREALVLDRRRTHRGTGVVRHLAGHPGHCLPEQGLQRLTPRRAARTSCARRSRSSRSMAVGCSGEGFTPY